MITYKEILHSATKILSDNFNSDTVDIIDSDKVGVLKKECFYVSVVPISTKSVSRLSDSKSIMINIKYYNKKNNKLQCLDMANNLENLFSRFIRIKKHNKILNVSSTESNVFNDGVGWVLDFLIHIDYLDDNYLKVVEDEEASKLEMMLEVTINNKEVIK